MTSSKNIYGLDLMRTIAILMVLSSHTLLLFDTFYFKGIELFNFFGFYGVEIFFVLSGYLIGNILYKSYVLDDFSINTLRVFWIHRWLRTLPNYFLALTINLFLAFFVWKNIPERIWSYFVFLQNSDFQPLFFNESWSLSIEEYAYVLLPVVLFLFSKIKNRNLTFLLSTILLLVIFLFSKINYHCQNGSTDLNYWNTHLKAVIWYRIDAIIYGVLGAWLLNNYEINADKYKKSLLLLSFLLIAFLLFGIGYLQLTIDKYPLFWNVLYLPIASLSVFFSLPFFSSWQSIDNFFARPVVFVSKISYSIYLYHYFIILYLYRIIFEKHISEPLEIMVYVYCYLAIVFVVAYLIYTYFEKPILKWRDKNYS